MDEDFPYPHLDPEDDPNYIDDTTHDDGPLEETEDEEVPF